MAHSARTAKSDHENTNIWRKCGKQVRGFLNNTSVHGVKYLAEFRRPYTERVLWFLSIILSMIICGYLINESWKVRASSPVILALNKKQRAVWDIPFPAITICPTEKIRLPTDLSPEQRHDVFCAMSLLCETSRDVEKCNNSSNIIKAMITSAPKTHELFVSTPLSTMGVVLGLEDETARPLLTSGGLCYSINMFPGSALFANNTFHKSGMYLDNNFIVSWDIENGYKNNDYGSRYPRPALGSGKDAGLLVLLKNEAIFNTSTACNFIHGFELEVHNPADFPSGGQLYYAPLNSVVQMFITPEEVISDDLRAYTPEQRQCYYPDEHQLKFFGVYSQKNCELECLSQVALDCCGCAAYYMPRSEGTPICLTEKQKICALEAKYRMHAYASGMENQDVGVCRGMKTQCNCLPSCTYVRYRYQVTHTEVDAEVLEGLYRNRYNVSVNEGSNFTIIEVFYTETHFIPLRRMEFYGTVEFLANCGGVLGVCLGVSILSIVELFYWLLVRPFCRAAAARAGGDAPRASLKSSTAPREEEEQMIGLVRQGRTTS